MNRKPEQRVRELQRGERWHRGAIVRSPLKAARKPKRR